MLDPIQEVAPVSQTNFGGKTICGRGGGKAFAEVQRPVKENGEYSCPTGTTPCSLVTSPENTVCYPPDDHVNSCPINEIRFVLNEELVSIEGEYGQATFNSQFTLLYSKTNLDALPITTTSVTKAPCLDPARSADFIAPGDDQSTLTRVK